MRFPRYPAKFDIFFVILFIWLALGQLHGWADPLTQNERDFYLLMLMAGLFVRGSGR